MADRFYTPQPLGPGEFVLAGAEAHHLATVRRFAPGDRVTLFNGDGHDYPAEVLAADRKRVTLTVSPAVPAHRELGFEVVVLSALPKGDRADFLIEKLTELGVARFIPLVTARSVVQPKEAKAEKLLRGVIEASKQCGRNVLMRIDPARRWNEAIALADLPTYKVILHTSDAEPVGTPPRTGVAFAVGPEGGFTPDEIAAAVAAGWRLASLGPTVLRVETAAVAAAAWAALGR
jgi:16S rRNA (uracil1498-N3)-methyltransferase